MRAANTDQRDRVVDLTEYRSARPVEARCDQEKDNDEADKAIDQVAYHILLAARVLSSYNKRRQ